MNKCSTRNRYSWVSFQTCLVFQSVSGTTNMNQIKLKQLDLEGDADSLIERLMTLATKNFDFFLIALPDTSPNRLAGNTFWLKRHGLN